MRKRYVSLVAKFAIIFVVFIVLMLAVSGASIYYNQSKIDHDTRLIHMQQINTFFDSLITGDGETFLAYQNLLLQYKDEVPIPLNVEGYEEAETDFYKSFYEEYPGGIPGEKPGYYDMSRELQIKFVVYQHEYWLDLFETARPDMNLIYTYYVVPTGEEGHVYWMIDMQRDPSEALGDEYLNLCLDVLDAKNDGHENMWYALENGKPSPDYDVYDNEYGKTYAYYRPIVIDGTVRGAVGMEVEIASVNKDILNNTVRQLLSLSLALVVAVLLLLKWIDKRYIKKIEKLSANVKQYAEAKDAEISAAIESDAVGNDELSALANQTAAMILELDNYMKSLVATTNELTQTRERAERLGELAIKDSLTGIRNKTAYDQEVKKLAWSLEDGESKFGICIVDLNFLKRINDTYGHEKGNVAIKKICKIICDVFEHSPVFRIGGDEFAIILKNQDYENIDALIEAFDKTLEGLANDKSLEPWEAVSAAIGYAKYDEARDSSVDNVFKRADKVMYDRKKEMKAVRE